MRNDFTKSRSEIHRECSWKLKNDLILFSVTSNGVTGKDWITRLEMHGYRIGGYAKSILLSPDFSPTSGITSQICVVPSKIFSNSPTNAEVRMHLDNHDIGHGQVVNAEIACLIREKFSNKDLEDMGLWWIVLMHQKIHDNRGDPYLLFSSRVVDGLWLFADNDYPECKWSRSGGFAGLLSQNSS